jgi:hypothetical protein
LVGGEIRRERERERGREGERTGSVREREQQGSKKKRERGRECKKKKKLVLSNFVLTFSFVGRLCLRRGLFKASRGIWLGEEGGPLAQGEKNKERERRG